MADSKPVSQLPSPPFIHVDGIANFRDVGGYPTHPSGSVRRGILFRSANPTHVTSSGLETMQRLEIRKVFDLRSEPEVVKGSMAEGRSAGKASGNQGNATEASRSPFYTANEPGTVSEDVSGGSQTSVGTTNGNKDDLIERVWCPVFKDVDYTSAATFNRYKPWADLPTSEAIAKGYTDIFTSAGTAYRTVLDHLASADPTPCLIHCTAGKDRTGGLTALVLLLCGVDKQTIANEYSLTTQGLGPQLVEYKKRFMSIFDVPNKERIIDLILSSDAESMVATIDMLQKDFGGAEQYVKHVVGLDDSKIAALRRNLMTQEKAVL